MLSILISILVMCLIFGLIISKTKLIWCQGRIRGKNGKRIDWAEFIEYMNSRP
jgi:hypothetical protein